MAEGLRILFLEDNTDDLALLQRTLNKSNVSFTASHADDRESFISNLTTFLPDIILSDHSMPQFDSLSALEIVKEKYPYIPFILVTGSVSEEFAVKCIKSGAEDYVLKDNLIRLPSVIEHAINKKDLQTENTVIRDLNQKLKTANELVAKKNKDVIDSITYARRIQKAMQPDKRLLYKHLPQSFVLYKPKDIVSGDFYWFAEHNGKLIIAVSDCTGHGVPGAMLTMIGYNILRNIVYLKNIVEPADILNEMNTEFQNIFEISNKNSDSIKDGMDIAICSIDKTASNLTFASAKRPLYLIRNNELVEYKGSSLPIGGGHNERHPYKEEKITLKKGDRYYMFTDGFADQFGGDKGKKLKMSGFKNLLHELNNLKMDDFKKALNHNFEMWKLDEEQTDDLLIVGFEID